MNVPITITDADIRRGWKSGDGTTPLELAVYRAIHHDAYIRLDGDRLILQRAGYPAALVTLPPAAVEWQQAFDLDIEPAQPMTFELGLAPHMLRQIEEHTRA